MESGSSDGMPINSVNDGTALSWSLKYVVRLLGVGGDWGVLASVAKERVERKALGIRRKGGALRHLNLLAVAAMIEMLRQEEGKLPLCVDCKCGRIFGSRKISRRDSHTSRELILKLKLFEFISIYI